MALRLFNTMTRQVEEFVPLEQGKVRMYVCGPTVYNFFHIGNARAFVTFDMVRRYLMFSGYDVTYVQNFTDVDDKMIRRAEEMQLTVPDVAQIYIKEYFEDADAIGIQRANVHPRVTDNMEQIIDIIQTLIKQGHAYEADGDVYFATDTFPEYGKLSHQPIEDLQAGSRVEVSEKKRNPLDFALWKAAKPGEIKWDSPWGEGRPGWHIECSAMSRRYLGEQIDIHAGGSDLIFPHHENEIAQSEGASGKPFARYWIHNGYVNINNEKMSKSLGNALNVHDLRTLYPAAVLRFFLLSVHYRHPINFSAEIMEQCANAVERIETSLVNLEHRIQSARSGEANVDTDAHIRAFREAMDNDFNTADAMAALFDTVRDANLYLRRDDVTKEGLEAYASIIRTLGDFFGILSTREEADTAEIDRLVAERTRLRKERKYDDADRIREQLDKMGILMEDTPQGPRWRRK